MTGFTLYNLCMTNDYYNQGNSHLYYKHNSKYYQVDDSVLDIMCNPYLSYNYFYNKLFNYDMFILFIYLISYSILGYYCFYVSNYIHTNPQLQVHIVENKDSSTEESNEESEEEATDEEASTEEDNNTDTTDNEESEFKDSNSVNQYLLNIFIRQVVQHFNTEVFYYLYPDTGIKKIVQYYLFDTKSTITDNNEVVDAEETYNQIQNNLGSKYFCHNPDQFKYYPITHYLKDNNVTFNTSFNELHFINWLIQTKIFSHVIQNKERLLNEMEKNKYISDEEYQKYYNSISLESLKVNNNDNNNDNEDNTNNNNKDNSNNDDNN